MHIFMQRNENDEVKITNKKANLQLMDNLWKREQTIGNEIVIKDILEEKSFQLKKYPFSLLFAIS